MSKQNILRSLFIALTAVLLATGCKGALDFQESYTPPATDDPYALHTYTLENGLTLFVSPNSAQPSFRSEIVTRAGSGEDPADATGLAHYLEHLLFKGNQNLGTTNYASEKVYLDKIEQLYQQLFSETDPAKRQAIFKEIDKQSVLSTQYVVFNEFDSLYKNLGQTDVNAFTSYDQTTFLVELPKNRLEPWAIIESNRFINPVFRTFQWELEVVFEEKNRSLDNPSWRTWEALAANTFPGHPYGDQTTIGSIEHLKNPPLHKVHEYFNKYYVPNNMAIVISGDVNPDEVFQQVKKYFSGWKPKTLPKPTPMAKALAKPTEQALQGPGESQVLLGFPVEVGSQTDWASLDVTIGLINRLLNNLTIAGQIKGGEASMDQMRAGAAVFIEIKPMPERSLAETKTLFMEKLGQLKAGTIDATDFAGVKLKKEIEAKLILEKNDTRTGAIREHYVRGQPWTQTYKYPELVAQVSQSKVVQTANSYFTVNHSTIFYENGVYNAPKVPKPSITPLTGVGSAGSHSDFYLSVLAKAKSAAPISPKFIDFDKDAKLTDLANGVQVMVAPNPYNDIGQVTFTFYYNLLENPLNCFWVEVLQKADTQSTTQTEFMKNLFKQGVTLSYQCERDRMNVSLIGPENQLLSAATDVFAFIRQPKLTPNLLSIVADSMIQSRQEQMSDATEISKVARAFMQEGNYSKFLLDPSSVDLKAAKPADYQKFVNELFTAKRTVAYVGNSPTDQVVQSAQNLFPEDTADSSTTKELPHQRSLQSQQTRVVFLNNPGMSQSHLWILRSLYPFEPKWREQTQDVEIYLRYLSGDMSSPFFQEIREKRALAYSAWARAFTPTKEKDEFNLIGFVGTQSNKFTDAFNVTQDLLNKTVMSPLDFTTAVAGLTSDIESQWPSFREIPGSIFLAQRLGYNEDPRAESYRHLKVASAGSVQAVVQSQIQNQPFVFVVVGDESRMDLSELKKLGPIEYVTLDKIVNF